MDTIGEKEVRCPKSHVFQVEYVIGSAEMFQGVPCPVCREKVRLYIGRLIQGNSRTKRKGGNSS
jgi:hypothetical protein